MTDEVQGKIIVIIESEDKEFNFEDFDLTFDSTPEEIMNAVAPAVEEQYGIDIKEEGMYIVNKAENSKNVYIRPKSPAGA